MLKRTVNGFHNRFLSVLGCSNIYIVQYIVIFNLQVHEKKVTVRPLTLKSQWIFIKSCGFFFTNAWFFVFQKTWRYIFSSFSSNPVILQQYIPLTHSAAYNAHYRPYIQGQPGMWIRIRIMLASRIQIRVENICQNNGKLA